MKTSDYLIEIRDLVIRIEQDNGAILPVNGMNLKVRRNEMHGLTGLSGEGKTMTALALLGLVGVEPGIAGGSILYGGRDLLEGLERLLTWKPKRNKRPARLLKDRARWARTIDKRFQEIRGSEIALVTQEPRSALDPVLTVLDQIKELIDGQPKDEAGMRDRALQILKKVDAHDPADMIRKYPHEMSGGECQRVSIGLALGSGAKVLVADEPTSSLDTPTQREILEGFRKMVDKRGYTIILITHNLKLISEYCDSYTVMLAGRDVEFASNRIGDYDHAFRHPYMLDLKRLVDATLNRKNSN